MTVGRPAILVPYPHAVDDHQTFNAHAFDEVGGGWLMSEESFTPNGLAERLCSLLTVPKILKRAAECARNSGQTDAAVKLADAVCDLIGKDENERKVA
jgi:UDP-N-acetylglucosamine--N-acetylmuramyl-(pentapeptide) pyrophosphoryl-undecaprenol N-acetylglucosamine transferase